MMAAAKQETVLTVKNLSMAYGDYILQRDISFTVSRGDIFFIMGGSGCGKSTLLRHLIGLKEPAQGKILYGDIDFWALNDEERASVMHHAGILYQGSALWSSMTLAENVALPLQHYTDLQPSLVRDLVHLKLSYVGLVGFEDYYPSQLSGGMRKRAAIARAIALDPKFLFFDEPSAGLDPVSAMRLDELILELRDTLGATLIIVSHDLASIYSIANNSVFLDSSAQTMLAAGDPKLLLKNSDNQTVIDFLTRGTGNREVPCL